MTDEEKAFQHWATLAVEAQAKLAEADAAQTRALLAAGTAAAAWAAAREAALMAAKEEKSIEGVIK